MSLPTALDLQIRSALAGRDQSGGVDDFVGSDSAVRKGQHVIATAISNGFNPHKTAFLSVGGADGTELAHVLENTSATRGVLIEFDDALSNSARQKAQDLKRQNKDMRVLTGDAVQKVPIALAQVGAWKSEGQIGALVVTMHAVLHELQDRGAQTTDLEGFLQRFLWQRFPVLLIVREPCAPRDLPDTVYLSAACDVVLLSQFAERIRAQHKAFASLSKPVPMAKAVRLDSRLAAETIVKLFYLKSFLYESGERVTAYSRDELLTVFRRVFGTDVVRHEDLQSDSFERYWREHGLKLQDNHLRELAKPQLHVRLVVALPSSGGVPGSGSPSAESWTSMDVPVIAQLSDSRAEQWPGTSTVRASNRSVINSFNRLEVSPRFLDRTVHLESLQQSLLSEGISLVAIIGREGLGKSALASHVLAGLELRLTADEVPPFDAFVYLSANDGSLTFDAFVLDVGQALGTNFHRQLQGALANSHLSTLQVLTHLYECLIEAGRKVLVFLDQFDSVVKEHKILHKPLAQSLEFFAQRRTALKLLIASRVPFDIEPRCLPRVKYLEMATGLPEHDAITFLRTRDSDGIYGLRDAPLTLLSRAVSVAGGNPRALELLLALIYSHPGLSLSQIVDNRTLAAAATVDTLVARTLGSLDERFRAVVEALAVFREPVPIEALTHVLGVRIGTEDLTAVVSQLVRSGIVLYAKQTARYGLHSTDRDFIHRRLARSPEADALAVLETKAGEYWQSTQRPMDAHGTIKDLSPTLNAYQHFLNAHAYEAAASHFGAIDVQFLLPWGFSRKVLALRRPLNSHLTDPLLRIHHHFAVGLAYRDLGLCRRALKELTRALEIAESNSGSRLMLAEILATLSDAHRLLGDYEQAVESAHRACDLFSKFNHRAGEVRSLVLAGAALRRLGDFAGAIEHGERAIALTNAVPVPILKEQGDAFWQTGQAYRRAGALNTALKYFETGLNHARATGDRAGAGTALNNMAQTYVSAGVWSEALPRAEQALAVHRAVHNVHRAALCILTIGTAYLLKRDYAEAIVHLMRARRLLSKLGDFYAAGYCAIYLVRAFAATSNLRAATEYAEAAVGTFIRPHSNSQRLAVALLEVVREAATTNIPALARAVTACATAYVEEGINFSDALDMATEGLKLTKDEALVKVLELARDRAQSAVDSVGTNVV